MKKIIFIFFMSLLSFSGYSQLALEDFEDPWVGTPPTPTASWLSLNNGVGPAVNWAQGTGSAVQPGYNSTHAAYLNKEQVTNGTFAEDYLVTPEFPVPVGGQLRFWSRLSQAGNQGSTYKILIVSLTDNAGADVNDISDYVEIQTWTELELNVLDQTVYEEKVVEIPDAYIGDQVRIAFMMSNDDGDRWLVDDVRVVKECLPASNLTAENMGLTTAELSWDVPAGQDQAWEIEIVAGGSAPTGHGIVYSGTLPYMASSTASASPLVQTPFLPNTDYKFYVRSLCDDTGVSEWVGAFYFSTVGLGDNCSAPIVIGGLPYSDTDNTANFDDQYSGFPGSGCGNQGWEDYLGGNDVVYSFTPNFTGTVSVDMFNNGDNSGVFVYEECADIGVDCYAGGTSTWEGFPVSYEMAVTSGEDYYVVISSYSNQTTPYDLLIQQVFCDKPEGLPTTNLGMTTANLSWTNPSGATSWQVEVQPLGTAVPSGAGEYTAATNTNFAVPSAALTASTAYQYWVRADCGDGTFSAWAGPYPFNTAICDVADQCTYTFDMWNQWNGTWNDYTMNVIQNGIVIATLSGPDNWGIGHVYQSVQVCEGFPLQLFWNNDGSSWGAQEVGVAITNGFDQPIYTKNPGTGSPNTTLYDVATIDCDTPLCLAPTGLYGANATINTIDLGWAGPATGDWEYYIVEAGDPAPTDATSGTVTTTNPVTAPGLDQATNYEFYVRLDCEGATTDFSPWAGPFQVSTSVCPEAEKCDFTFTMRSDWWTGWDGGYMTISQGGINVATIGSTFTDGQTQDVTVALCHGLPFEIFFNGFGTTYEGQIGLSVVNSFDQPLFDLPFYQSGNVGTIIFEGDVDCLVPLCLAPTGLYAENGTMTTIDLGWDGPAVGTWEYYIVEAGDPAPTDATSGTATTSNPTIGAPLAAPATNYEYYVRLDCEGASTDFSPWAGPFEIHSEVCDPADKCVFQFEMRSQNGWGYEGNTMTISQGGVPAATIGGEFTWGQSMMVDVPLCPGVDIEVYWNTGGWDAYEKGLTIFTPFLEDIYVKDFGEGTQGSVLFTGAVSCDPPPCPKPQNLDVTNVELTEVTLNWEEMGDAENWTVWVLPFGSEDPTATTPGGIDVTTNPMVYGDDASEVLLPGTPYLFFVMADCGEEDGISTMSGPFTFVTAIANDDCEGATNAPSNIGIECNVVTAGTLTGATGSGITPSCMWGEPVADVWYSFEATATTMAVSIQNTTGGIYPYQAIYEGDCDGGLTELYCGYDTTVSLDDLTIGNTYYVMVYVTYLNDPTAVTSFDVCIRVPEPPITVSDDEYTIEELVQDVLLGSDCAVISNVTSLTGTDFSSNNGIGYFNRNNSSFPFDEGIILATTTIHEAPAGAPIGFDSSSWPGDADLAALIAPAGWTGPQYNATILEFDFVPLTESMSFDFLFASDEYGIYQCGYSDAFAFILTGPAPSTTSENLAVIPNTNIPVSVVTIRDDAYNASCPDANVEYFDQFNGNDPIGASISFNGQTVVMEASADVVPGATYHIKMVISDYNDAGVNSAVFIGGGSFDVGSVDLGLDLVEDNDNALCNGGVATLNTNLDTDLYNFVWLFDEDPTDAVEPVEIDGETGPTLIVSQDSDPETIEAGLYIVHAYYEGTTCFKVGDVMVEFYDDVAVIAGDPADLTICDGSGFGEFDLSSNTATILDAPGIEDPSDYTVTYHFSQADAEADSNPLDLTYTNVTQFEQFIYVRIEHVAGCVGYKVFRLVVEDNTAAITLTDDFSLCEGSTGTVTATVVETGVTYAWTKDGDPLADTTSTITVDESGVYEVTVTNNGCTSTDFVTVTVVDAPVADTPSDVTECTSYTLPALSTGNNYYSATGGTGTAYPAGHVVTATQTFFVYAQSGTTPNCTDESTFTVTINAPVFDLGGPYVTCVADNVTINVNASNFNTADADYAWTLNDTPVDGGASIVPSGFGTYEVTVTVNGCSTTSSVEVTANTIAVELSITDSCEDDVYTVTAADFEGSFEPASATFAWTGPAGFTSASQSIEPIATGEYFVTVTTADGCVGTGMLDVLSTSCDIQRGISPNGDDKNQFFDLSTLDVNHLSIFNRYGQEVYSRNNYKKEWFGQGSNGDELPTGTYFYMIERKNGESITGWVYINREEK